MSPTNRDDKSLLLKYLSLLELALERPSLEYLTRIVHAHLNRIPFENISKLLYFRRDGVRYVPDLATYLDAALRFHFGGTCYSNNPYLCQLLQWLGFDAELNGCDMQTPDVHIVIRVKLEGREYLVDVGYAAPFLDPMLISNSVVYETELGISRYVLRARDTEGRSRMDLFRRGELAHKYIVKPIPREHSYFRPAIEDSYRATATFMTSLLLTRYSRERSVVIYNYALTEFEGKRESVTRLNDFTELVSAIEQQFNIPRSLSEEALHGVELSGNAWS